MKTPFEFKDYKVYLKTIEDSGRFNAFRTFLAGAAGCQGAYVSHVLNGSRHFSMEQAEKIASALSLIDEEKAFFLLLIQYARAGTPSLEKFFADQIKSVIEKRLSIRNRLDTGDSLTEVDQVTYYSEWYYSAIHVLVTITQFQNIELIVERLKLPLSVVKRAVDFLIGCGLLVEKNGRFSTGQMRLFLSGDSPLISRHHANWRLHTLQSLHRATIDDLHYSSVVTVSLQDSERIRELLIQAIQNAKDIVRESSEDDIHSFSVDFYKL